METKAFKKWLSDAIALWQGEHDYSAWEITDGEYSVCIDLSDGYKITHTDLVLTAEQVEDLFDYVSDEEQDRNDNLFPNNDPIDDYEQGLYGYGY